MTTELAPRDESVRETTVDIQESKAITGKYGAQWELKVRWPWTNPDNKYSDTVWVEQKDVPRQPPPGLFNVRVSHRAMVQKKEGAHDGSQDWMWHWSILNFLSKADAMPTQTPATSGKAPQTSSQDVYRRSKEEMRWTEAYHMASRVQSGLGMSEGMSGEEMETSMVSWAGWFYNELVAVTQPPPNGEHPCSCTQCVSGQHICGQANCACMLIQEPETPPPVADARPPGDDLPF